MTDNQDEINILNSEIEDLKAQIGSLENNKNVEEFCEMLDDTNPEIKIGNLTYSPSNVLKNTDEIAFRCGMSDYNDSRLTDLNDELEQKEQELKDLIEDNDLK